MALSDPTNVRLGLARKQELLKRLAAQMASKGPAGAAGRGGRAQGTGSQFASAANLRPGGTPRMTLPFTLPNGRARPAGFDPNAQANDWSAPQDLAPVIPQGPPAGGGTGGNTTYNDLGADPAAGWTGGSPPPGMISSGDPGMISSGGSQGFVFGDPNSPFDPSGPLNAPDPYTMMATAQMQRLMAGRNYAV